MLSDMIRKLLSILLALQVVFPIYSHSSETSGLVFGGIGDSTLDRVVSAAGRSVQLTAANESSSASFRIGRESSRMGDRIGRFSSQYLLFTVPLNKNGSDTDAATLDGISNATTAKYVFNSFKWPGVPVEENMREQARYDEICKVAENGFVAEGGVISDFSCDSNMIKLHAGHFFEEFELLVISPAKLTDLRTWRTIWGFSGTIGYNDYVFYDQDSYEKLKTRKNPWAVGGHFGVLVPNQLNDFFLTFGYDYVSVYKSVEESVICPVDISVQSVTCLSASFGSPNKTKKRLGYIEFRGLVSGIGYSIKLTRNFDDNVTDINVPINIVRNVKNDINAGVRIGWDDSSHDFKVGVFVGSGFKIF